MNRHSKNDFVHDCGFILFCRACALSEGPGVIVVAPVRSGLPPDQPEAELTETALFASESACIDDLRRVRDMGVRIALDDFGAGYSAPSYLQMAGFDKVEIDGSGLRPCRGRRSPQVLNRKAALKYRV